MRSAIRALSSNPDRLLDWLVALIALHSLAVGAALVFLTEWGVRFGGWTGAYPLFFPRQFGVFHFAIAAAYLIERFAYRGVSILLVAKFVAFVSLIDATFRFGDSWTIPLSAIGDGLMGLVVFVVWRWTQRWPRGLHPSASRQH
ncbi:MAG: hypothetical protein H6Q08_1871 [Acidobacteria bacterium]|jgi:hypothetical protein|nr:hypothetical protein [Acidobacteriota bacterium]